MNDTSRNTEKFKSWDFQECRGSYANILGIQGLKHPWPKRLTSLHEERKTSAYVSEWTGFACISVPFSLSLNRTEEVRLREQQSGGGSQGGEGDEKHLLRTSVNTRCSVYFRTTSPVSYCIRITYLFIVTSLDGSPRPGPWFADCCSTRWRHFPASQLHGPSSSSFSMEKLQIIKYIVILLN